MHPLSFALVVFVSLPLAVFGQSFSSGLTAAASYSLPSLGWHEADLEPEISRDTVIAHHMGHQAGYTRKLNEALAEAAEKYPFVKHLALPQLLQRLADNPKEIAEPLRSALTINAGGYLNHALYFWLLKPPRYQTQSAPGSLLQQRLVADFGSVEGFKAEFSREAETLLGSGYVWLVLDTSERPMGKLRIVKTVNQNSVWSDKTLRPVLVIDVWEHAYYLDQKNLRAQYVAAWWSLIGWDKIDQAYKDAIAVFAAEKHDEL
eukprot:comp17400_c0_seq1/m.29344 comp17400_c0_seq1/g.29344  ORF comp17400_c0_seq1/g.29344 comp17400_c0_seq1/m.29344 type:complete len:261 (-) comp17400_c0_seq1:42-824(-)